MFFLSWLLIEDLFVNFSSIWDLVGKLHGILCPGNTIYCTKIYFDLLGADAEECHKQWLALGLISVLLSKVQSFKIVPLCSESDCLNSIDS